MNEDQWDAFNAYTKTDIIHPGDLLEKLTPKELLRVREWDFRERFYLRQLAEEWEGDFSFIFFGDVFGDWRVEVVNKDGSLQKTLRKETTIWNNSKNKQVDFYSY